jgi:hypothetical protein
MKIRKAALVLVTTCSALLAIPMAANAATTTHGTSIKNIPVSGQSHSGKAFKGHFTVTQFATRGGKTVALGTLTGKLGTHNVKATKASFPVTLPTGNMASTSAVCPILHLDLGPLTLNLLGLNVHLNEVILDITATSGPGNLLGNLLCGVSNLLNGSASSLTGPQTAGLLNIAEQLLNSGSLLTL